ncbi:S-adenosyl-L-methionine-dependent methyltransferase [Pyrrhoderma noxium]|uniref:S-adenosyl-L-methionine-dependent methyltransferase n=1 Tax=Pyrrhoderma noxium TaxID=2282107 RepID=A0A286UIS3_9AGAM|nr:S-adenosyl-L-methionine-dependent methyltransferase [Pyrrhoderma noxium]
MKKPERDPGSYRLWPWLSFISLACIVLFPAKSQLASLNIPLNEYDILDRSFSGDIFLKTTTVLVLGSLVLIKSSSFKSWSRFIWHTIIAPNGQDDHQTGIDKFYAGQADIYDKTRERLLVGRKTMLRLAVAQIKATRRSKESRRLVWVDIGGGTGYNIEAMDEFLPIQTFDAIYLVDICEPLLEIARQRFATRGWTNVHVICDDAAKFILPEEDWHENGEASISFATFSYSLSMIPDFFTVLDRVYHLLVPETGILSVVDFYTSSKTPLQSSEISGLERECSWFSRWFWQIWFDFDRVHLGPQRRDYIEHKFSTVKNFNGRNKRLLPFISIPYYIWLGRRTDSNETLKRPKDFESEFTTFDIGYAKTSWRIKYDMRPMQKDMKTFLYSFTWEDPYDDMRHLKISDKDSLLVITSAGDNALHYALKARPKEIHCVDVNPCQGHLLELKLSALSVLSYDEFFAMFGLGQLPTFSDVLDSKLAPYISAPCYQFWRMNTHMFTSSSSLYMHGHSGAALRFSRALFRLFGKSGDVGRLCDADTISEQENIWRESLRPIFVNRLAAFLLGGSIFCWRALGVPMNQLRMVLSEGSVIQYIKDTLDPISSLGTLKNGCYHYYLTLMGRYSKSSCPLYLTKEGFEALSANNGALTYSLKLHTDTISNTLASMKHSSLSRAVIMDHLDWFAEGSQDVTDEVELLFKALKLGGFVLLRSAARNPWYMKTFSSTGFRITCLSSRTPGCKEAIDRVNMYASLWKAEKV